jgi:acetyl-CoA carboxylase biotin carboxyl carrier protein
VELDFNQLRELLAALDKTDISEVILKSGDVELTVRKGIADGERLFPLVPNVQSPDPTQGMRGDPSSGSQTPVSDPSSSRINSSEASLADQSPGAGSPSDAPVPPSSDNKWVAVAAPMVGTFYRAPAPDEPPFVNVGDRITVGQTVCIIEAMKLMNEIEAEVSGEVMEIVVDNAEPVEYEQVLMRIKPD